MDYDGRTQDTIYGSLNTGERLMVLLFNAKE